MSDSSPPPPRYRVLQVLGRNAQGEPATYLAQQTATGCQVVIKHWPLTELTAAAIAKRQLILANLHHSGLARYLNCFIQQGKFYDVREYVTAASLATQHRFQPEEIKAIAVSLLETLADLQAQIPPLMHGNLKPENVFWRSSSAQGRATILTDFGLMLTGLTGSGLAEKRQPFGFAPPEQAWQQFSKASDNYAIGAVLLGLLSGTPTDQMDTLTCQTEPYRYRVRERLAAIEAELNPHFLDWLERMVEPDLAARFPDARTALQALLPLKVVARAQIALSHSAIRLHAPTVGRTLQTTMRVSNQMPATVLMGQWRVAPLPYDAGDWIRIHPDRFTGNERTFVVTVETAQLMIDSTYRRELILQSNSEQPVLIVPLVVETGGLVPPRPPLPKGYLLSLLICSSLLPITLAIAIAIMAP